jgi:hypothetical protein
MWRPRTRSRVSRCSLSTSPNGTVYPGWPLNINGDTLAPINQNGPAAWQGTLQMSQRSGWSRWTLRRPRWPAPFRAPRRLWPSLTPELGLRWTRGGRPWKSVFHHRQWSYRHYQRSGLLGTIRAPVGARQATGACRYVVPDLLAADNQHAASDHVWPVAWLRARRAATTPSPTNLWFPPGLQPEFGGPGPLNVFGPYSDTYGSVDYAKGRSTGAFFRAADGSNFLFVSGSSKAAVDSQTTVRHASSSCPSSHRSESRLTMRWRLRKTRLAFRRPARRGSPAMVRTTPSSGSWWPTFRSPPRWWRERIASHPLRARPGDAAGAVDQHPIHVECGRQIQCTGFWTQHGLRGYRSHSGVWLGSGPDIGAGTLSPLKGACYASCAGSTPVRSILVWQRSEHRPFCHLRSGIRQSGWRGAISSCRGHC